MRCNHSGQEEALESNALLQIQKLEAANIKKKSLRKEVVGLWDPGSTLSFITFKAAKELRLQGEPIELELVTVGGTRKKVESQRYRLVIFDQNNQEASLDVLGIDQISTAIEQVNLNEVLHLFSNQDRVSKVDRPNSGEIDLLIGFDYAAYHPVKIEEIDHLLLMENRFGFLVAGAHPCMNENTKKLVKHAIVLHTSINVEEFFSIEALGVTCYPKCGSCSCGKCHTGGKSMTLAEEKEHELIKKGLVFVEQTGRWLAHYPWIKDPECLPDNKHFAHATLRSTERRLQRNSIHAETYQNQINDMVQRKVARLISEEELGTYPGKKFYIAHHDILSPNSVSTPMRVVFNSKAKVKGGVSLNDCLAKGPCLLNQLLGILLRFRLEQFAFIGDIRKMYHSIDIPLTDQMTHLFLWRDLKENQRPKTYAITAVNMGDRPAAAIAQTALRMTAEEAESEYPEASRLIIENSYMDDIPGSIETKEKGLKLMKETEEILQKKGFKIKNWTFSGQKMEQEKSKDQIAVQALLKKEVENDIGKVLGMEWETEADVIRFKLNQLSDRKETTKRQCLSTICSIYDPMGLLAPVTVSAKIILRKIWASKPSIDWDDTLPDDLQKEWNGFRESLRYVQSISFQRALKPKEATSPVLVIFSDGSKNAYGAAAYIRWKTPDGFKSNLVAAKSRIAPLKVINIVRLELCGAVLNARLFAFILKEMADIQFERIFHIIDSEIVKAQIDRDSYGFSSFVANRIGEIHDTTDRENFYWVEGDLNVADMTTRECTALDLGEQSEWQMGPNFLRLPIESWPTQSATNVSKIPEVKKKFVGTTVLKPLSSSIASVIDITRFSKLSRLLYTTARIQKLYTRFKAGKREFKPEILPSDLRKAEQTWVKYVQEDMYTELDKGSFKKLVPSIEDGVIVVGGRTERWMESTWNQQKFILLPKNHYLSRLIVEEEHNHIGHLAAESTIARVRSKYWIIGIRRTVNSVINECRKCKEKFKKLAVQKMSPLPVERLKPSPPFQNIGVDYFGPFEIKGEVQKRVRGKCYGVLFVCDSSRAVHADIAQNFSTEAFLQVLRRFGCLRGWPRKIHSDNGTQLVGAANQLKNAIQGLNWDEIQKYGHKFQTEWSFNPADAPWQNGSTEALVKTIKRALKTSIGNQVFTFAEFQTIMFEAAQIVNQRPIGRKPTGPEEGSYLSPNDLLLGRSTNHVPQGPFAESSSMKQRMQFLQEIVNRFWKQWSREVFPNMVIEPKWHTGKRDVQKGDVVLIQDSNTVRGEWKMGRVTQILESKDGRVRNVEVKYINGSTEMKVKRPVQRLIVIVPKDNNTNKEE